MTQESALGKNVGACYLTNNATGDGVNAKSGTALDSVMNPTRDVPPFLEILKEIGGDPSKTLVSCPQSIGWGGAMGPAQFIASTWMIIKDRLAAAVGISGMPDPWNPAHAFMATAMYLADRGAVSGSYSSEKNAACKYYSGSACTKSSLVAGYGASVMALADNIQTTMIEPLQGL
jgi:membrane-bound lytic murein transglycosylase B